MNNIYIKMPSYVCNICNKPFTMKTDYIRHINKKYKCKLLNNLELINIKDENNTYKCINCNKIFKFKSHYERHNNSKFSCIENNNDIHKTEINNECIVPSKKEYDCIRCQKSFTTKKSLNRHINEYCKSKSDTDKDDLLQLINVLQYELVEEKNKNKVQNIPLNNSFEINGNNNTATNNSNNVMNNNNITNNITINAYGKEDLSHITDNDYKTLFTKCNSLIPMLVELIHFNKDKSENTNVYISNIKSPNAYVFDGNKWILKNKSELIGDIYDNKCIIIIDKFDDMKEILNKNTIDLFSKFIEKHDSTYMRKSASDKIQLILYNNRDLIKNK
jgi:uncharacterized C2H2 Zn-finger protein